ncbi:ABC transporter substrate-binding protein [Yinghuangia seranimata]|uniref:ABC transporter substrate-binding protein n=1 Tax=Yinghuangia seranimata TaxID=408067 RepID=UPI00248CE4E9|nr:ABC transporter substrate-binding protein [Yinghuangia seranimata]MDI2124671.1 ABC transporter substrate-binding protein [Yinghuangia seranimata]
MTVRGVLGSRCAAVLTAAIVAATAAGCTVEDKEKQAAPFGGGPASGAAATAPGVTADAIRVGIAYPDMESIKAFVNIDLGSYEDAYKALIAKVNAAGGINGRKIVPVFGKVSVISPALAQQTCVALTQDEKVFAVLANFVMPGQTDCYVETNKTALVAAPQPKEAYTKAQAPWFAENSGDDQFADTVRILIDRGVYAGKKLAVIGDVQSQATTEKAVLPLLQKAGITPVVTGYLPAVGLDAAALAQQSGVMLQKARAAGADVVLLTGSAGQTMPAVIEKTDWRPRMTFAGIPNGYLMDKAKHDFSVLNGAETAGATLDWDHDPAIRDCVATMETAHPDLKGKLRDPNSVPSGQPNPSASLWTACINITLFKAITDKAGHDLNYRTFQDAGFGLGGFHIPSYVENATYGPNSTSGAIPLRAMTYDPATNRFVPVAG